MNIGEEMTKAYNDSLPKTPNYKPLGADNEQYKPLGYKATYRDRIEAVFGRNELLGKRG